MATKCNTMLNSQSPDCLDISNFEVITPFRQTIIHTLTNTDVEEANLNYTSYDIFCLETQLTLYLTKEFKLTSEQIDNLKFKDSRLTNFGVAPKFINKFLYGEMIVSIDIYSGSEKITLNPDQCKKIQEKVNDIIANRQNYAIVLSSEIPIDLPLSKDIRYSRKRTEYPRIWLRSILPYLSVPEELNSFIQEGSLYVQFIPGPNSYTERTQEPPQVGSRGPGYREYLKDYNTLLDSLYSQIAFYYTNGVLAVTSSFAKKWQLHPIPQPSIQVEWTPSLQLLIDYSDITKISGSEALGELIEQVKYRNEIIPGLNNDDDNFGLYIANWNDNRFVTSSVVDFLMDRQLSDRVAIEISDNFVVRHFVAQALKEFKNTSEPIFSGNFVWISILNLHDLQRLTSIIYRAKRLASGRVLSMILSSQEMIKPTTLASDLLVPGNSFHGQRSVTYQTDNQRLVFSSEVSRNVDLISLTEKVYAQSLLNQKKDLRDKTENDGQRLIKTKSIK